MFFLLTSISLSSINFQIILKIDHQVVTTYDLEQERNYLLALNPRLNEVDEKILLDIAKKSITKEVNKKFEEVFPSEEALKKEFNSGLKINITSKAANSTIINNYRNNNKRLNFDGNLKKASSYKF